MLQKIMPPALKPGDTIGVFAPSSYVERADIERATAMIEARGYQVFVHPQTYEREHQSAGTNLQKAMAFQGLWQRDDMAAIWAAGGGNRCLHWLEQVKFEHLNQKPKPLIGFSDVTALLNTVTAHTGLTSFHGPVFKNLDKYNEIDHLLALLSGGKPPYPFKDTQVLREGQAEGHLVGGNLSLVQYLPQILPDDYWGEAILFLEDCHEELSKIDRMMWSLRAQGVLERINGLIIGEFSALTDSGRPFGFTLADIVTEHTQGLNIPIIMDAPFGHGHRLYTLPIGCRATINTSEALFQLTESPVLK